MTAYIGADNQLTGGTFTYSNSTEVSGFEMANLTDYKTSTAFKVGKTGLNVVQWDAGSGNTITVDYVGVIGHNLYDNTATLNIRYSDDAASWTTLFDKTPTTNKAIFERVSSAETHRYWQIRVTGADSTDTTIAHLSLGEAVTLRPLGVGFKPPTYTQYTAVNSRSNDANYIGRSIKRVPQKLRIKQTAIEPADFRTSYVPMLDDIMRSPFFFSWDYDNYSGEAAYCWIDRAAPDPVYSHLCHMAIDINCQAIVS